MCDQWDWEKIIAPEQRNNDYLMETVREIVQAICSTEKTMRALFPTLDVLPKTDPDVTFITTQELEDRYPDLSPKERETLSSGSIPPPSCARSARPCVPESPTTAAPRTMTTGP